MSTLPEITEALCSAYLRGEWSRLPSLSMQAAAKMGGDRMLRLQELHRAKQSGSPTRPALKHWTLVRPQRSAAAPKAVEAAIENWRNELRHAGALFDAGERVPPLLLVGPTRCGKTSSAQKAAVEFGLPVYRLALAEAVGSFLGETVAKLAMAVKEMAEPAIWLLDELDAVAQRRGGEGGADKERAHAIGWLLTALDELPPSTPLIATTNMVANIDAAVVARFQVVEWPSWDMLSSDDREGFATSHGDIHGARLGSYSAAVAHGRACRVARILEKAKSEAAE